MIHSVRQISDHALLGVWKLNESLDELKALSSDEEIDFCQKYHPEKQREHLASRLLIEHMCNHKGWDFIGITKDDHGKPFFKSLPYHLSISHGHNWIGVMIDQEHSCGLDIESPREQLLKIKKKYLGPKEQEACGNDLHLLCLYWCAKEAVYKIYGRRQLSFADNIRIENISGDTISTKIVNTPNEADIELYFEKIDEVYLVHSGKSMAPV